MGDVDTMTQQLALKADAAAVDRKADAAAVDRKLKLQVDGQTVTVKQAVQQLKEMQTNMNQLLASKADRDAVTQQSTLKADAEELRTQINRIDQAFLTEVIEPRVKELL